MIDVAADSGWLATALGCMNLVQMIMQGRRIDDPSVMTLPKVSGAAAAALEQAGIRATVAQVAALSQLAPHELEQLRMSRSSTPQTVRDVLIAAGLGREAADEAAKVANRLPLLLVKAELCEARRKPSTSEGGSDPEDSAHDDLMVTLVRRGNVGRGGSAATGPRAYTPGFVKARVRISFDMACELMLYEQHARSVSTWQPRPLLDFRSLPPRGIFSQLKQEEGWWLVAGDRRSRELYALKRLSFASKTTAKLSLPRAAAGKGSALTLYVVSDCYLGLDQEIRVTGAHEELALSAGGAGDVAGALPQRENRVRRAAAAAAAATSGPAAKIARISSAHATLSCKLAGGFNGAEGGDGEEESDTEEFWDMEYTRG